MHTGFLPNSLGKGKSFFPPHKNPGAGGSKQALTENKPQIPVVFMPFVFLSYLLLFF